MKFADHLVFQIADIARTELLQHFLGERSHRTDESVMYAAGVTHLYLTNPPGRENGKYDKEDIGLNHIDFGVHTSDELRHVEDRLDRSGILHSGIAVDQYRLTDFIWLDDPDELRLEFYLRVESFPA